MQAVFGRLILNRSLGLYGNVYMLVAAGPGPTNSSQNAHFAAMEATLVMTPQPIRLTGASPEFPYQSLLNGPRRRVKSCRTDRCRRQQRHRILCK